MTISMRFLLLLLLVLHPAHADPAASGELYQFGSTPDPTGVRADHGAVLSIVPRNGAPALKVDLPASTGYPGVTFPAPGDGWDLSDHAGVQVDLTNPGAKAVDMTMRIESKGGADPASWSVQVFHSPPGKTETLKVRFGQSFGGQSAAVDKARVTAVRLYPNPPKAPFTVLLENLKAFKSAAAPAPAATPAPTPPKPEPVVEKPEPPAPPVFPATPLLDISGKHDFPDAAILNDDAASQLKGLCSLADFRALPETDRHVYSFDPWPGAKDDLAQQNYSFNFLLGTEGVTSQKVAFMPSGGGAGSTHTLIRSKDAAAAG